jgi:hypothetical protein
MAETCEGKIRVRQGCERPLTIPFIARSGELAETNCFRAAFFARMPRNHVGERDMLRKLIIGAVVSVGAMVAVPAAASAQGYYRDGYQGRSYDGYRDGRRYDGYRGYRRDRYRGSRRYYRPRSRVNVYYAPSYGYGYYPGYYGGYGGGYYGRGYYNSGYGYGGRGYYGRSRYRCGDGTTGAIVGGATGALVGREIGRDGRGYRGRYRGRGSGTTGAIIGGALGALIGREATRC